MAQNSGGKLYLSMLCLLLLSGFAAQRARAQEGDVALPDLRWQRRSDWIDVRTDIKPPAAGDGKQDDTQAIQAALDLLGEEQGKGAVYLPTGRYRITRSLRLTKKRGGMIVGNGRETRLVWDGPNLEPMLISEGGSRFRFNGLIWDGQSRAAVGIEHASASYYETRVRHQDEAFLDFKQAGIRVGNHQKIPSAEMMFYNCLFKNCNTGVGLLEYNDYDNDFDGCEFVDCAIGINCPRGNFYVRDSRFLHSSDTDMVLSYHHNSIRRCRSIGSRRFVTNGPGGGHSEVVIQDCRVDGWTGHDGAITLGLRGPDLIFDCVFTHSPDNAPPIRLRNGSNVRQTLLLSHNAGSNPLVDRGPNSVVMNIPAGRRGGSLSAADSATLRTERQVSGRVYDVKTQFGAKGDGKSDDTQAILRAIQAAREQGNGAIAYLPIGHYLVTRTLPITGSNYTVGGAGYDTVVEWKGNGPQTVFAVRDPQNVTLENMQIEGGDDIARVQQTSAGGASTMIYDGVYVGWTVHTAADKFGVGGHIVSTEVPRGLECVDLPAGAVVHMIHLDGSMKFIDCARATILADFAAGGVLEVEGTKYDHTGILGIQTRINSGNPTDNIVRDNNDLTIADCYTEQTQHFLLLEGRASTRSGKVTIQPAKLHTYDSVAITIDNYRGRFALMDGNFPYNTYQIVQTGSNPVDILLLGNAFFGQGPTLHTQSGGRVELMGNLVTNQTVQDPQELVPDRNVEAASAVAASALDDLRELGALDLRINHPNAVAP